ncbi:serine-protein kinase atm-like [Plakobranchus ocellatus]|uniref:Serine-protein kinase atm-like n=1 Tax=Plakobranchus ocellatus TaxID=259542 RepID=A0AAV4AVU6_9GAST|nr:serine-protein kinase atm-like [Plakobranchus ocellatus]
MVKHNDQTGNDGRDSSGFSPCTVNQQFPHLLLETSLTVRAFVAGSLNWLFVGTEAGTQRDRRTQTKIFDEIFMLCSELVNVERGTTLDSKDELANDQGIFLHVLLTIIKCSPVCEKHCLLGLFQMVADKEITLELVKKMLLQACSHLGYADVEQYLASHLPYLVYNWLHDKMVGSPLADFPYQLLGYTEAAQFTRAYPNLVVSTLLATKLDIGQVRAVLTLAKLDVHSSLLSALPDILVHILPPFAAKSGRDKGEATLSSSQQALTKQYQEANKCFSALKQGLSDQEINERVCDILGVIVVKVLSCLQVKGHTNTDVSHSMVYPESNPPCYSEDKIVLTLNYLARNFNDDSGGTEFSLVGLLAKIPNGLHEVFLSLSSQLWKAHHAHEGSRCLQMVGIFVRLVLKELRPGGGGRRGSAETAATVIVRDILNRLLVILRGR